MREPDLFDVIDRLTAALPLDAAKTAAALGVAVVRKPADDTPAIEAYGLADNDSGPYSEVDLRLPDADIGTGTVLLCVTPRSDGGITLTEIIARRGPDFQLTPPSPRYKRGSVPTYVEYAQPWGTLSFGVTVDGAQRLLQFILNVNAPA